MSRCEHCPLTDSSKCNSGVCAFVAKNPAINGPIVKAKLEPPLAGERIEIPESDRQLVVSHFHEDLAWLADVPSGWSVVVYSKGGSLDSLPPGVPVRRLANRGREAATYLHHLTTRWDQLAETTVFCQGDTVAVHCPDFLDRIQHIETDSYTSLTQFYSATFPEDSIKAKDQIIYKNGYEIRLGDADLYCGMALENIPSWTDGFWSRYFQSPKPEKLFFGYGSIWKVRRSAILHRPYGWWSAALTDLTSKISVLNDETDFTSPWAWEIIFGYAFDSSYQHREIGTELPPPPKPKPLKTFSTQHQKKLSEVKKRLSKGGCGCRKSRS